MGETRDSMQTRRYDSASAFVGGDPLVVRTPAGDVRGVQVGDTRQFLGVPFAEPPLGDLRWRAPRPAQPWSGIRNATNPAQGCAQILPVVDMAMGEEDCLYLNVTAPAEPADELVPVMVWIHGGGFTVGSANDNPPTHLVERSGVVVVSIAYRLGPFGFLAHPALRAEDETGAVGTMGFLDQVAALEWVRDNIETFGGDPGNVTIFGESAGGMSVFGHVVSPRSAGLFRRAIIQSAPANMVGIDLEAALVQGEELASLLGCSGARDPIAALRDVDAATILQAMPPDPTFLFRQAAMWFPVGDGVVLPPDAAAAVAAGDWNKVPILAGVTRDEGRLFIGMACHTFGSTEPPVTAAGYLDRAVSYFGDVVGPQVVDRYPLSDYPDPGAAFGQAVGDATISANAISGAKALAADVPVHLYQYEHAPNPFILPIEGIDLGAFHSSELPYVFGGPVQSSGPIEFDDAERALSDTVIDAWTRFAATDDPSTVTQPWPEAGEQHRYLALDATVRLEQGLGDEVCAFWDAMAWGPEMAGRQGLG